MTSVCIMRGREGDTVIKAFAKVLHFGFAIRDYRDITVVPAISSRWTQQRCVAPLYNPRASYEVTDGRNLAWLHYMFSSRKVKR